MPHSKKFATQQMLVRILSGLNERCDHRMNIHENNCFMSLFREEMKLAPFESKSWPDLVGKPVDAAIEEIRRENPGTTRFARRRL